MNIIKRILIVSILASLFTMACSNETEKKLPNKKEEFYIEASVGEWTVNRDTSLYYKYYLPVETTLKTIRRKI